MPPRKVPPSDRHQEGRFLACQGLHDGLWLVATPQIPSKAQRRIRWKPFVLYELRQHHGQRAGNPANGVDPETPGARRRDQLAAVRPAQRRHGPASEEREHVTVQICRVEPDRAGLQRRTDRFQPASRVCLQRLDRDGRLAFQVKVSGSEPFTDLPGDKDGGLFVADLLCTAVSSMGDEHPPGPFVKFDLHPHRALRHFYRSLSRSARIASLRRVPRP